MTGVALSRSPTDAPLSVPLMEEFQPSERRVETEFRSVEALPEKKQPEKPEFAAAVLNHADVAILVLDTDGRVVCSNTTWERLTDSRPEEIKGRVFWELPALASKAEGERAAFARLLSIGVPRQHESVWRIGDGIRLISWSYTFLRNDDEAIEYIIATGLDPAPLNTPLPHPESLMQALPDVVCVLDLEGRILRWNRQLERVTGLKGAELERRRATEFFPQEYRAFFYDWLREVVRNGRAEGEVELTAPHGRIPYHFKGVPLKNEDGTVVALTAIGRDVSQHRQLEEQLRRTESHFRALAEHSPMGVGLCLERFVYVNPAMESITGYGCRELLAMGPEDLGLTISDIDQGREVHILTKDGGNKWVLVSENAIEYGERMARLVNLIDITEKKQLERELREYATVDHLTRIYNRAEFERRLHSEIARINRYGGSLSLIMFDVDHFKQINDIGGHQTGDYVLATLASLIRRNIRASDHIGRWGGEEFMILAPAMALSDAAGFAVKLRTVLADYHFETIGSVTASFGVAEYRPGESAETLVRRADEALYRAKKRGRNRVEAESR